MNVKFQLDSTGRMISFNGYVLYSFMNVIKPYKEKVSEIFKSKDVENVYLFKKQNKTKQPTIHNKNQVPGPLGLVRVRGDKCPHPTQLVKEEVSRTVFIVHKLVFPNLSALFFYSIQRLRHIEILH